MNLVRLEMGRDLALRRTIRLSWRTANAICLESLLGDFISDDANSAKDFDFIIHGINIGPSHLMNMIT
jgi:hypothetical protein